MNKKTRAFTVVEITLAVTIIAVIAILTIGNKENAEARRIKKNKAVSHSFYSNILTVYQKALLKKDYKGSATNIAGTNAKKKSENVRNLLLEYLDGEKSDCTNIKNIAKSTKSKSFVNDNMACFTTPSKIMGAVYFDTKCTNSYSIKEFSDEENPNTYKNVSNSCGYILYGLTDSKGEYGKDLFTIALGNRNVKK